MIDLVLVNPIVRKGQLAIGEKEVRITSNCLIQQIHSLEKALLWRVKRERYLDVVN